MIIIMISNCVLSRKVHKARWFIKHACYFGKIIFEHIYYITIQFMMNQCISVDQLDKIYNIMQCTSNQTIVFEVTIKKIAQKIQENLREEHQKICFCNIGCSCSITTPRYYFIDLGPRINGHTLDHDLFNRYRTKCSKIIFLK